MNAPGSRVLLTGSRGFTGIHLRRELEAAGYRVVGLVNEGQVGASEYFGDLTDAASMHALALAVAPDYVIHLAAITYVGHDATGEFYSTNVIGTLNLLEALSALPKKPVRVVLASSANVYGNISVPAIDEGCPCSPVNHYAASKVAMEAVAAVFRTELSLTITRPFNYTGPGQSNQFLVPKIVSHFARRLPRIELGNLDIERDFLDVRTVAGLYRRLLESGAAALETVNLCSGHGYTLRSILGILERITGHSIHVDVNPALVRPNEIRRLVGSDRLLRRLLGDVPQMPFEQTLDDMLAVAGAGA
jgi:nucleoside-diphosphate-sugar epimerase